MSPALSPDALRLLDANLNRAREALRLVEDYARFALNDAELCGTLKHLRHELTDATRAHGQQAIAWRDTPGDIGTAISTPNELRRQDLAAAVTAAGKRFTEAVRVVEELLKINVADQAGRIETVRYGFYEVERRIALTLRPAEAFAHVRLYVILTEAVCRHDWLTSASLALAGGATCIQLREPDLPSGELLARAKKLQPLCRDANVPLIINDRPDVALLAGADGVHVGQGDLPAEQVRKLIGPRLLLGVSTHNLEQIQAARLSGADYVGVGPVFASTTKPRPEMQGRLPGLDFARAAAASGLLPTVAIGGIGPDNAARVWQTGVQSLAVASAVTASDAPDQAARDILHRLSDSPE